MVASLGFLIVGLVALMPLAARAIAAPVRAAQDAAPRSVESSSRGESLRFRVLTYNIHHGEGVDGKLDLERIANVIRASDADLVALQEVDRGTERTDRVDQAAELARLSGLHVCFGGNLRHQGGDYGNAILSRFPIVSHRNHSLPNVDGGEPRGVLEARIAVPGLPVPLKFLCTHLDHRPQEGNRIAAAEAIEQLVAVDAATPTLLAGDLNAVPHSEPLRRFFTTWRSVNQEPLPTIPASSPNRQIDYILFLPPESWKTIEARVVDEPVASDHAPLLAVLQWQETGGEEVVRDDFRSGLTEGWSWVREHREFWRTSERGLEIRVEPGNLWGPANDAKNVLVRSAPRPAEGRVIATVTVENQPTEQYEQANLVWYYNDAHMVKLGQELVDGQLSIVMGREEGDRARTINIIPIDAARVQVRLVVDAEEIRGLFRTAGEGSWQEAGRCSLPVRGDPKISLQCYQGPADQERWVVFSDFSVRQQPTP